MAFLAGSFFRAGFKAVTYLPTLSNFMPEVSQGKRTLAFICHAVVVQCTCLQVWALLISPALNLAACCVGNRAFFTLKQVQAGYSGAAWNSRYFCH